MELCKKRMPKHAYSIKQTLQGQDTYQCSQTIGWTPFWSKRFYKQTGTKERKQTEILYVVKRMKPVLPYEKYIHSSSPSQLFTWDLQIVINYIIS